MALPDNEDLTPRSRTGQTARPGAVFRRLAHMVDHGEEGVLATVVVTHLSAPRHAGSKMIVHGDGSLTGTIGGGSAEALVAERATGVLESGECQMVSIDLAGGHGVCGGSMEVFLEPVQRAAPFVVIGAGHVGQALITLGQTLSFRFTIVDDRPEFLATAGLVPGVQTILASPDELPGLLTVPRRGAVLVCSRNHQLDAGYLEVLLRMELAAERPFTFFGSLGSRAKAAKLRRMIGEFDELAERMKQVRLPVGIEMGAETPAEIALSVLAEAQAVLRGVEPVISPEGARGFPLQGDRQ
jgi:xanthine dehydrogenase accessory factor